MEDNNYTLVMWPESQTYMDESWFDEEAVLDFECKFGSQAYFIPTKYFKPYEELEEIKCWKCFSEDGIRSRCDC